MADHAETTVLSPVSPISPPLSRKGTESIADSDKDEMVRRSRALPPYLLPITYYLHAPPSGVTVAAAAQSAAVVTRQPLAALVTRQAGAGVDTICYCRDGSPL